MQIPGNKTANNLANEICQQPALPGPDLLTRAGRRSCEQLVADLELWWQHNAPLRYQRLGISFSACRTPRKLKILCWALGIVLVARFHRGYFGWYYRCFQHDDAVATCAHGYGHSTSLNHLFDCYSVPSLRPLLEEKPPRQMNSVAGSRRDPVAGKLE